jgi:hypothetical protein
MELLGETIVWNPLRLGGRGRAASSSTRGLPALNFLSDLIVIVCGYWIPGMPVACLPPPVLYAVILYATAKV